MLLSDEAKKEILKLARAVISEYLKSGKKISYSPRDEALKQRGSCFVTLKIQENLRGCIGNLQASGLVYESVIDNAVSAAVRDPRFAPLNLKELDECGIEVSVLSPMRKAASHEEIEMGKHGVVVVDKLHGGSGVFLPQVATETGWDKKTFLEQLCVQKAGLSKDAYLNKEKCDLYIFDAVVFNEKEFGIKKKP